MTRWLPHPLVFALLLALWLLLNRTLEADQVLVGASIAVGASLTLRLLQIPQARVRNLVVIVSLAWLVAKDIVRSNIAVARIVLSKRRASRVSAFIDIPLTLRNPSALAVLACIITATPGTAWARYDSARDILTIHVLDLTDEPALVNTIKEDYERRLLEIFG